MNKKQKVITEIYRLCKKENKYIFHNNMVKEVSKKYGFGNPFDATKIDKSDTLPDILKKDDYFIIHLGSGNHKFAKGISTAFHKFEEINDNETFEWKYRKSILNEFDTSESNILSVGFNQRIIHDFLYDDIVASPKSYGARRTKASFNFQINDELIETNNLQMEIDLTTEFNGQVTVFEGKNNFPSNFAVYQIFFPYLYYNKLKYENKIEIKEINCCYLLRKKQKDSSVIRIYKYTFDNPNEMNSIRLLKKAQFNLVNR